MRAAGHPFEQLQDGMHKLVKRAPTSTTTTKARTTTATTAVSVVASSNAVASTSATTPTTVPTTPPSAHTSTSSLPLSRYGSTFAQIESTYSPPATSKSKAAAVTTGASSSNSTSSAKPVLSKPALYGIIAGAGAIGLAILAMLVWWCVKKRKSKKEEAKWWKLDAPGGGANSNYNGGNGKIIVGNPVKMEDSEPWAKGASAGMGDGEKSWGVRDRSTTPNAPPPAFQQQQHPYAPALPSKAALSAREQLLGTESNPPRSPPRHGDQDRDNLRGVLEASASSNASSVLPPYTGKAGTYKSPSEPPVRPPRPSQLPPASMGVAPRDRTSSSTVPRSTKKDTVMGIADAYGNDYEDEADPWRANAIRTSQAMPRPPSQAVVPPKRGASIRGQRNVAGSAAPLVPGGSSARPRPPTKEATFPPRPRSKIQEAANPSGDFPRVDSKPLRELEDILDSFAYQSKRGTLPPVPESDSIRGSTATTSTASGRPPRSRTGTEPQVAQQQSLAPSTSTDTLSPTSASMNAPRANPNNTYEVNRHPMSIYSSQGDIGELDPPSIPNSPDKPNFAVNVVPPKPAAQTSPVKPIVPQIIRSDSNGRSIFRSGLSDGFSSRPASSIMSDTNDEESPAKTEFVRKISLKKTEAPVRLDREESLRRKQEGKVFGDDHEVDEPVRRRPTPAERDVLAQMGFDDSPHSSVPASSPTPSSSGTSPPETPRDFNFGPLSPGPLGGARKLQQTSEEQLHAAGFVPLSAMSLDPAAQNYRSATESIYGMYDDLPEDLKGLPRNDPRISRHISMFGLSAR
ncbi:hypothetical protein T439DRAFT_322900 [Meredithblackwellia eburnea MCA 4105]